MKKFNELMVLNNNEISDEEKSFKQTHEIIMSAGRMFAESIIQIATNFKRMKDEKLYTVAGFETFEQYTEDACGIKARQAYSYIKVLDTFDNEFLQSTAKIGITKLSLLTQLTEEEREQLSEGVNIEEVSTRELKEAIRKLEEERDELQGQYKIDLSELQEKLSQANEERQQAIVSETEALSNQIKKLKTEIEKLKNKPAEVVTVKDDKSIEKIKEYEEKLKKQAELLKEKEIALKELNTQKEQKEKELKEVQKEKEVASNQNLLTFKIKFEQFQNSGMELINFIVNLPAEQKAPCAKAFESVIGGWVIC